MATAEELLTIAANAEAEPHIVIDSTRTVTVPAELRTIAVQYDHNIETVTFDAPRYWDEHDLSTMKVFVNYMRADKKTGQYHCGDVTIDSDDSSIMHFTWTISGHVTEVTGALSFLITVKYTDEEGNLKNRWSSFLNQEMTIKQGMDASSAIADENPDVITAILLRLDEVDATISNYSVEVDTTLTQEGMAADSKAVGDALTELAANISPTVEVDTTLTQEGMAADSKAVGDALNTLATTGGTTMLLDVKLPTGNCMGDVDGDGYISQKDAYRVLGYTVGVYTSDDLNVDLADVNGDGEIKNTDAMLILQYAMGEITNFGTETDVGDWHWDTTNYYYYYDIPVTGLSATCSVVVTARGPYNSSAYVGALCLTDTVRICMKSVPTAIISCDVIYGATGDTITLNVINTDDITLLDDSLTIEGMAADAKAVGDTIGELPIAIAEDGYTDITGLRQATSVTMAKVDNVITVTTILEGDQEHTDTITLNDDGYPVTVVSDGVECTLTWEGFE